MPALLKPPLSRFADPEHFFQRLADRWKFRINYRAHRKLKRWGHCGRCYVTWNRRESHVTFFNKHNGISALCNLCFAQLTPEQRLPYYADVIRLRIRQAIPPMDTQYMRMGEWSEIREAVLRGL